MPSKPDDLLSYLRVVLGAWRNDPRDDDELLARFARDSDGEAFKALVGRYGLLVWRCCTRVLGEGPDAEDAFQAAFLALARKARCLPIKNLAGWLHQVARRAALNAEAGVRRRRSLEQQLLAITQPEREDSLGRTELYTALDEELASLPERLRIPLVLRYLEGKTLEDVARVIGCSRRVLGERLTRGEVILRQRLERRGLAVGVGSVAVLLGSSTIGLGVPTRLIGSTARAAVAFHSGTLTGGAAEAARTVLGALPVSSIGMTIMRKSLWIVLACCLGLAGAGLVTYRSLSAQLDEPSGGGPAAAQTASQSGAAARVDCFGDPLPAHALARMGTVRQWYGRLDFAPYTVLAFSDDKTLVSQSKDGSICLWDAATGREIRRIIRDSNPSTCTMTPLALSPDGRTLVTGRKGTVYLWEMATGKFLRKQKYQGPKRDNVPQSLKVVFLPGGQMLCLGAFVKSVDKETKWGVTGAYVWDVATGKEISQLSGPRKGLFIPPETVAFSPDGKMMAAVSNAVNGGKIILWEVATGKKIRHLQLTAEMAKPVYSVAFSPDDKTLAIGGEEGICVWEAATGKPIHRFKAGGSGFSCPLAYSPDGKTLLGGWEGHLWDVATGKEIRLFGWENAQVAVFSPSGKVLAMGDNAGVIRLWEAATGKEILPHKGHHDRVTSLAYSPDGKTLASVSADRTVRLWEVTTGKEIRQLAKHDAMTWGSSCLAYSPDGKMLVSMDTAVHLWDTATGKEIRRFQEKESPQSVTFSPDGKLLAATVGGETVCLWQVATGKQLYALSTGRSSAAEPWSVVFSPDGRLLAGPGKDNTVSLWEVATGKPIAQLQLKQNGRGVRSLAFSPDGRILATSSAGRRAGDDKVSLWEVATGKEICQLKGRKDGRVGDWSLRFSPDGRMLATVEREAEGNAKKIHLWEAASGKEIGQLSEHRSTIRSVAFSPDGKTLASGSDDLTCLIWDLTSFGGRLKPAPERSLPAQALSQERLEAAWAELAQDPAQAYAAVRALQAVPTQAIPLLRERVRPVAPVADPQQLKRWIVDLDANNFTVRDKAQREIEKLGEPAIHALRQALKDRPALEVKRRLKDLLAELEPKMVGGSPQRMRELRAVQVLESVGTAEARQVLQALAKGVAGARLTQEAEAALARLVKCSAARP